LDYQPFLIKLRLADMFVPMNLLAKYIKSGILWSLLHGLLSLNNTSWQIAPNKKGGAYFNLPPYISLKDQIVLFI
jgi:hypothetical protein